MIMSHVGLDLMITRYFFVLFFARLKETFIPNCKAGSKNQKLVLFIPGKAMSAAPSIKGTNQLPNLV